MCVFKNGTFYHYEFQLDGRRHRGSTGTASKPQAIAEERLQREQPFGLIINQQDVDSLLGSRCLQPLLHWFTPLRLIQARQKLCGRCSMHAGLCRTFFLKAGYAADLLPAGAVRNPPPKKGKA